MSEELPPPRETTPPVAANPMFAEGAERPQVTPQSGAPDLPPEAVQEAVDRTVQLVERQSLKDSRDEIGEVIVWKHPITKAPIELQKFVLRYQKMWASLRQAEGGSNMGEVIIVMYLLTHDMQETTSMFRRSMWEDVEMNMQTGQPVTPEEREELKKEKGDSYLPLFQRQYQLNPLLDAIEKWGDETFLSSTALGGDDNKFGAKACYNAVFNRITAAKAEPLKSEEDGDDDGKDSKVKN